MKPKKPIKRKFSVTVEVYERYSTGPTRRSKFVAESIAELFKKIDKKYDNISYYIDMEDEKWDQKSDKELIKELESSNGDGGDYIIVDELKGKKLIRLIGEDQVDEDEEANNEW